jgi:hypothetical protein
LIKENDEPVEESDESQPIDQDEEWMSENREVGL